MSEKVFFNPISSLPNGSVPFAFPLPRTATFYSHPFPSPISISHFLPLPVGYYSSEHLLLYSIDIMKHITSKLTTNGRLHMRKKLKIKFKMQNV